MKTLLFFISLALVVNIWALKQKARAKRHHTTFSWINRRFQNYGCRIRHWRTVLDRNGRFVKCTRQCGDLYDEAYSLNFGHYCKLFDLPKGCANRWCSQCKRGYYKVGYALYGLQLARTNRCVSQCPDGTVARGRGCVERPPKGCQDRYCTRCSRGYYKLGYDGHSWQKWKLRNSCVKKCPNGSVPVGRMCGEPHLEGCTDRWCSRCTRGYYRLGNRWLIFNVKKVKCVKKCPNGTTTRGKTCVDRPPKGCEDRYCVRCAQGYYKVGYDGQSWDHSGGRNSCVSQCPNGSVPVGRVCRKPSPEGCADSWCSTCKRGYYMLRNRLQIARTDKCVEKCPNGTVGIGKTCVDLPVGCSNLRCTSCVDGYLLWPYTTMTAWRIIERCQQSCPRGYFKNYKLNKCFRCQVPKCFQCGENENVCQQCTYGYKLMTSQSNTTCEKECPEGYEAYIDQKSLIHVCKQPGTITVKENITETIEEGCVDSLCAICKLDYYKIISATKGSECVHKCPQGYYTSAADCIPCIDPRCSECTNGPFVCDSCKSDFAIMHKEDNSSVDCMTDCPKGFRTVRVSNATKRCVKNPEPKCSINNCKKCLHEDFGQFHHGCAECERGFYLKRNIFKDECTGICPKGFYGGFKPRTKIAACLDCGVNFCKRCSSRKKCIECIPPFVVDFKKRICSLCPPETLFDAKTGKCKNISKKKKAKPTSSIFNIINRN